MKNSYFFFLLFLIALIFGGYIDLKEYYISQKANKLTNILHFYGVSFSMAKHISNVKYGIIPKDSLYYEQIEKLKDPNSNYLFETKDEVDSILNLK